MLLNPNSASGTATRNVHTLRTFYSLCRGCPFVFCRLPDLVLGNGIASLFLLICCADDREQTDSAPEQTMQPMMESHPSREMRPTRGHTKDVRSRIRAKIAVAELAHELAHELNNPLEALTNLLYLSKKAAAGDDLRKMLDEAEAQLARISTIVHSILALEKGDHEQRLQTAGRLLDPSTFRRFRAEYESALHWASIIEGAHDAI